MDELAIIERLKVIFASTGSDSSNQLRIGIGDDAAFFAPRSSGVAVATDLLTEGVHFNREWSDLYSIGRKATAANLADIFAMGLPATYLLVAVAFDPVDGEAIFELAKGIADECALVGAHVIGGDLSRGSALTVSMTAIGEGERVITRSGARPGDHLYLRSLPGRSLLGLEQLLRGLNLDPESIAFHQAPKVEYHSYLELGKDATSLCDISDGILIDAASLARASEVTIDLDSSAIEDHPQYSLMAQIASALGVDPLQSVLTSGEEHGPLFTAASGYTKAYSRKARSIRAHSIGVVKERGETLLTLDGQPIAERGFTHF
jgi:thiamine-monophosphate kinase